MKKWLALLLVTMLFSFAAYSGVKAETKVVLEPQVQQRTRMMAEGMQPPQEEEYASWQAFMEDYETFVDDYFELYNRRRANMGDNALLREYIRAGTTLIAWEKAVEKTRATLEEADIAAFEAVELRVEDKLSKIVPPGETAPTETTTEATTVPTTQEHVQTGENTDLWLWVALALACGSLLGGVMFSRKKYNAKE